MIEVENLVKRYGSHLAVDHLTFQVEPGKIYGFLGPNGAGKSTTMNILTGYIAATEGSVKINGYDILKDAEEAKKCIGYLPEIPPLYQDMTVKEYLIFAAALKKISKIKFKEQIDEIMNLTMISDIQDRLIKNLSKGYKQRVGLAQAVLGYPDVIILDEPTVGLDPKQIIEIRDLIKKLGEKHTVILSSHILSEVQAICDEIMIISKGKLVACDTPEGLTGRMAKSAQLELTIMGSEEKAERAIKGLKGIQAVRFEESSEKDCVKATIQADLSEDIRPSLFYVLAEEKLPIMALNRAEKSLEDVFLALTETDTWEEKEGKQNHDSDL
ncbi:MAG: ATP-binding cassette domain-containing protein [Lachnospiraceae bacterium]|nr:ATP-binding cassette domain-containing protein [Lachnospiraceae bacterium]